MNKRNEISLKDCLKDLYQLGMIQGEHNINWTDEYGRLEHSKNYYNKTKTIADKYNIKYDTFIEDYREYDGEEEFCLWDKSASHMNEIIREHILKIISDDENI
jgi:hypothetical protein